MFEPKEGRCQYCGGALIHEEAYFPNPPRDYCHACGREVKAVSNNLDPQKEEEVKALLKDHSVREIVKETGVAKNTITRIRNENLTDEEKVEFKKQANVRGRNQRELQKGERIIPQIIPSGEKDNKIELLQKPKRRGRPQKLVKEFLQKEGHRVIETKPPDEIHTATEVELLKNKEIETMFRVFKIPENLNFVDIANGYFEYLEKLEDELESEIKKLIKKLGQARTHRVCLKEFLHADEHDKGLSEDNFFREYIEMESDLILDAE